MTDLSDNSSTATLAVKVQDTTPPALSLLPSTITVEMGSSLAEALELFTIYVEDGAELSNDWDSHEEKLAAVQSFEVRYTAVEHPEPGSTLTSVAVLKVRVVDTTPPVVTLRDSETDEVIQSITVEKGTALADVQARVQASTDDGSQVTDGDWSGVSLSSTGEFYVVYTSNDGYNTGTATLTVIVEDTVAPIITLRSAETGEEITEVEVEVGTRLSQVKKLVTAESNEKGAVIGTWESVASEKGRVVTGTYYVVFNTRDSSDNDAQSKTLIVRVVDNTAPTITLEPSQITLERGISLAEVLSSYKPQISLPDEEATVEDTWADLTQDDLDTITEEGAPRTITYTATDANGNSSQAVFSIFVEDTTPPEISLSYSIKRVNQGSSLSDFTLPVVTVAEGVSVSHDWETVVNFDRAGKYIVTYTATDAAGNTAKATVQVTVKGTGSVNFSEVRFRASRAVYHKYVSDTDLRVEVDGDYTGERRLVLGYLINLPTNTAFTFEESGSKFSIRNSANEVLTHMAPNNGTNFLVFEGAETEVKQYAETLILSYGNLGNNDFRFALPILSVVAEEEHDFDLEYVPRVQYATNLQWNYSVTVTDRPLDLDVTSLSTRQIWRGAADVGELLEDSNDVNAAFDVGEVGLYTIRYTAPDISGGTVRKSFEWIVWSPSWPTITALLTDTAYFPGFNVTSFVSFEDEQGTFNGSLRALWKKDGVQYGAERVVSSFANVSALSPQIPAPEIVEGDNYSVTFVYEERGSTNEFAYDEIFITVYPEPSWHLGNGTDVSRLSLELYPSADLISAAFTPAVLFKAGRRPDSLTINMTPSSGSVSGSSSSRDYKFVYGMDVEILSVVANYGAVSVNASPSDVTSRQWGRTGTGETLAVNVDRITVKRSARDLFLSVSALGVTAREDFSTDNVGNFSLEIDGLNEPGGKVAMIVSVEDELGEGFINLNYDFDYAWTSAADNRQTVLATQKKYRIAEGITELFATATATAKSETAPLGPLTMYLGSFSIEDSISVIQISTTAAASQAKRKAEKVEVVREQKEDGTVETLTEAKSRAFTATLQQALATNLSRRQRVDDEEDTVEITYIDADGEESTETVKKASDEVVYELNKAAVQEYMKSVPADAEIKLPASSFLPPAKMEKIAQKLKIAPEVLEQKEVQIVRTVVAADLTEELVEQEQIQGETTEQTRQRIVKAQAKEAAKPIQRSQKQYSALDAGSATAFKISAEPVAAVAILETTMVVERGLDNRYIIEAEKEDGTTVALPPLEIPEGETEATYIVNIGGQLVDIGLLSLLFSGTTYVTEISDIINSASTATISYTGDDPDGRELVLYAAGTTTTATVDVTRTQAPAGGGEGDYIFSIVAASGSVGPDGEAVFELRVPGEETVGDPLLTQPIPVHVGATLETLAGSAALSGFEISYDDGATFQTALDPTSITIPLDGKVYPSVTLRITAEANSEFPTLVRQAAQNALIDEGNDPAYSVHPTSGKALTTKLFTWQPLREDDEITYATFQISTQFNGSASLTTMFTLEQPDVAIYFDGVARAYTGDSFILSVIAINGNSAAVGWEPDIILADGGADYSAVFLDDTDETSPRVKRTRRFEVTTLNGFLGELSLSATVDIVTETTAVQIAPQPIITLSGSAPYESVAMNSTFIVIITATNSDVELGTWTPQITMDPLSYISESTLTVSDTATPDYLQRVQAFRVESMYNFAGLLSLVFRMGDVTETVTIFVESVEEEVEAGASADPYFTPFF